MNTWLNEQAAREIYLEVADKAITDGGAWSVMTGFNRWGAYWCGAYDNLLTGFLRGELGMRGMIITDYSGSSKYMDLADGLIAGSDIWDSPDPTIHTTLAPKYENDAYIVTEMRESMHKILYTVANSNAMNGWSSADRLKVITPVVEDRPVRSGHRSGCSDRAVHLAPGCCHQAQEDLDC